MVEEVNELPRAPYIRPNPARFYRTRQRVSMALLIFVVVVGLPIVAVPTLRTRLSTRVMALKEAMAGGGIKPATLQVGANHQPFPAEYQRPAPELPKFPELPKTPEKVFHVQTARPRAGSSMAGIEKSAPPAATAETRSTERAPEQTAQSAEPELKYQKGKSEQDAYDLLLKSNKTVAGLVQGSDPSLKFKSWDAANRGNDVYWVRLKFQSGADPEEEYIWQVKLQSNEVTPLSYKARSIS